MRLVSVTDIALGLAIKTATLVVKEHADRFGGTYFALSDDVGLIEVQLSQPEVDARLAAIRAALA